MLLIGFFPECKKTVCLTESHVPFSPIVSTALTRSNELPSKAFKIVRGGFDKKKMVIHGN